MDNLASYVGNKDVTTDPVTSHISSLEVFRNSWSCWQLLGLMVPPKDRTDSRQQLKRYSYMLWSIVVNLIGTCSFPIHLCLGIRRSATKSDLFQSVCIASTSIGATIKFIMYANELKSIRQMEDLIRKLDACITHKGDIKYYRENIRRTIFRIQRLYQISYITICVAAIIAVALSQPPRLFYPGWLPFDWHQSSWHYAAAIGYQFTALFFQVMQCYVDDIFPAKALCVLSAHIELLYMRVARIGHDDGSRIAGSDKASLQEQEDELNRYILQEIQLYELYDVIHAIISWPTFEQIFASVMNNCIAMVALLFYITSTFDRIYYVLYIAGMVLQIFPTCYYVSDIVLRFEKLHYAAFSCNWIGQSKSFKRHMMIFTERSLRQTRAMAGGFIPIHVGTFVATLKAAYSLFAVIVTMK